MAKIDRGVFFAKVRAAPFNGSFSDAQVAGLNAILDGFEAYYPNGQDPRWLAYELATAFKETNQTMQPVIEAYWLSEDWRKAHLRYYPYYGRGYVQLTWKQNYQEFSPIVGVDLVADPDKALDPAVAAKVMFYGMEHGVFAGHKLSDYFSPNLTSWTGARHIINGQDCAAQIAVYAQKFLAAL